MGARPDGRGVLRENVVDSGHGRRRSRLAGGWYSRPCIEQCEPEPREDSYRVRAEIREPDHLGLNSTAASQQGYLLSLYLVFFIFEEEGALRSCLTGWVFFNVSDACTSPLARCSHSEPQL